ncbi:cobalt ECF transporter T component CbiQ [Verrucosispora sp. SN26_14.1]|uniref:cobalt ECF transporter T component CbiQ n=1 Tax=Verrucosispora sp. SN26_14.1 TaxID=2527879 RepID=UPI001033DCA4|nr:cobalt ECF transporter T component CbiQ [Verrucosispora sp. SN26_14.1]TBL38569.1 cobalt ECF transporter T component CbiQ [Verrucosispora sp. SN26_14.1]
MLALDVAAYASPWRRRHPAEKALLALGLLGCALLLPPWPGALVVGLTAAVALLGPAALPPRLLVRVARTPLLFILTGSVPMLVAVSGPTQFRWAPEGLVTAATTAGRACAALLCLLLFAATTPLADVLPRLQRLGVPSAVTEVAALIYRMLFLLLESVHAVRQAQAARLGYRTWASTYRSLAGQAGAVFVRAFSLARRWEEGLALRGYTGSLAVRTEVRQPSAAFLVVTVLLLAAVVLATRLLVVLG